MKTANELLEIAWGVIANAGEGNWSKESEDWQGAAIRWRDDYFGFLDGITSEPEPERETYPVAAKCMNCATNCCINVEKRKRAFEGLGGRSHIVCPICACYDLVKAQ